MSAFMVDKVHVDALITAGLRKRYPTESPLAWYSSAPHMPGQQDRHELTRQTRNEVGSMLWTENLRSVSYLYPKDEDGQRPGPVDLTDEEIIAYAFSAIDRPLSPVAVLKALGCFEYQSCEHPGWETSEAKAFCEALRNWTVLKLEGYDDAPWSVSANDVFAPRGVTR